MSKPRTIRWGSLVVAVVAGYVVQYVCGSLSAYLICNDNLWNMTRQYFDPLSDYYSIVDWALYHVIVFVPIIILSVLGGLYIG